MPVLVAYMDNDSVPPMDSYATVDVTQSHQFLDFGDIVTFHFRLKEQTRIKYLTDLNLDVVKARAWTGSHMNSYPVCASGPYFDWSFTHDGYQYGTQPDVLAYYRLPYSITTQGGESHILYYQTRTVLWNPSPAPPSGGGGVPR